VNEGQEAKFTVKIAGGKPKPKVKWFKEEEEIITTIEETYEVIETEDTVTLILKSAKPENAGNYHAQLVNEAGQISTNKAQLVVNSMLFCFFSLLFAFILFLEKHAQIKSLQTSVYRRTCVRQGARASRPNKQRRNHKIRVHS
jgi:predicted PurR-regulated permease PerM